MLQSLLRQLDAFCPQYPLGIFDDCSLKDRTQHYLAGTDTFLYRKEFYARYGNNGRRYTFLGTRNLGVAAQSNRAIKWFMEETSCDHLVLCNDDIVVSNDFVKLYADAHEDLNVHLWCLCDFTSETYKWVTLNAVINKPDRHKESYTLKVLPRMTGIMMSMTRQLIERIGYFDSRFFFGEEHCDFTNRARFSGAMNINGQPLHCLDIEQPDPPYVRHAECDSTVSAAEKPALDSFASKEMKDAATAYVSKSWKKPYSLVRVKFSGAYDEVGIPVQDRCDNLPVVLPD